MSQTKINILILQQNRKLLLAGIIAFILLLFTQIRVMAYEDWGGFNVAQTIGGYQSLTIGYPLVDASLNIGTAPSVTTGTPSNSGNIATLNGDITSMGVASSAYTYFDWWQDGILHTTALQTKNAIGAVTSSVSYDPVKTLTFRLNTQVGAVTVNGAIETLAPIQGNNIFKTLIPIVLAIVVSVVILLVIVSSITIESLFIAAVGGTIVYFVVSAIINLLF